MRCSPHPVASDRNVERLPAGTDQPPGDGPAVGDADEVGRPAAVAVAGHLAPAGITRPHTAGGVDGQPVRQLGGEGAERSERAVAGPDAALHDPSGARQPEDQHLSVGRDHHAVGKGQAVEASRTASAQPSRRSSSIERALVVLQRGFGGIASRSSSTTERTPRRARSMASTVPTGPPPAISTGTCVVAAAGSPVMIGGHPCRPPTEPRRRQIVRVRLVRFLPVRVTEKGQVTIPKQLRDELGIGAGTEVAFERHDDTIVIRKAAGGPPRGRRLVERLRGRGDVAMSTDEIMALTRGD